MIYLRPRQVKSPPHQITPRSTLHRREARLAFGQTRLPNRSYLLGPLLFLQKSLHLNSAALKVCAPIANYYHYHFDQVI